MAGVVWGADAPPGGPHYTQSQMAAAIKAAGLDAETAHIFGAIGMGETSGWNFPTSNSTGRYNGPWAFQEAWTKPAGIDSNKLNTDLNYAAQQVVKLYKSSGWKPWYGDAPGSGGNYLRFMGNADDLTATVPGATTAGNTATATTAGSVVPGVDEITGFFKFISTGTNWLRVGLFIAACLVLAPALLHLAKTTPVGAAVKRAL